MIDGMAILKENHILFLGIMGSLYQCAVKVMVFIWTPLLQVTAMTLKINPGMIFILVLFSTLINNRLLEFMNLSCKVNYFIVANVYLVYLTSVFFVAYLFDDFTVRLIWVALFTLIITIMAEILMTAEMLVVAEEHRGVVLMALAGNLKKTKKNEFLFNFLIKIKYYEA